MELQLEEVEMFDTQQACCLQTESDNTDIMAKLHQRFRYMAVIWCAPAGLQQTLWCASCHI